MTFDLGHRSWIATRLTGAMSACYPHPLPPAYAAGAADRALCDALAEADGRPAVLRAMRTYLAGLGSGHGDVVDHALSRNSVP